MVGTLTRWTAGKYVGVRRWCDEKISNLLQRGCREAENNSRTVDHQVDEVERRLSKGFPILALRQTFKNPTPTKSSTKFRKPSH